VRGLVRFGVTHPVPVNLLMTAIILAGVVSSWTLRREFFPESDPEQAVVQLPYPGATPEEIEDALAIKVEDKLVDLQEEVDELRTTINEGGGGITVVFNEGQDPDEALDEIERVIDALQDLPAESEEIQASLIENRIPVIRLALYGPIDERVLKRAIRDVRDELRTLPGMGEVLIDGVRNYELRIEADQARLMEHGLSLPDVAQAVRSWMREVPGGTLRNRSGYLKVRAMGVEERVDAVSEIPVRADGQGRVLTVGELATVSDGFTEDRIINRFQGEPAAFITVFKVGKQDIVTMAEMVRAYVLARQGEPLKLTWLERIIDTPREEAYGLGANAPPLPAGAQVEDISDFARFVEGRLDLLLRNAVYGAILVFATLLFFLNWRVAMWVGVGLATALLGTLVLMQQGDVTLNLLTMFGLIVVLGLLVDDAIVVSENIQTLHDRGEPALRAAEDGATQVFWPVVATVMTSVVAFLPLTFIEGQIGDLLGALPLVVACALVMSLIESLLIMPSHMGHSLLRRDKARQGHVGEPAGWLMGFERWRDRLVLERFVPWFGRTLGLLLKHRYETLAVAFSILIVSAGMWAGDRVGWTFLPSNDAETILVNVTMPIGTPLDRTERIVKRIEQAARDQPETLSVATVIGERSNIETGNTEAASSHVAQMFIELVLVEERDKPSGDIIATIRSDLEGQLDEVEKVSFEELSGGPGGADITIRVSGDDPGQIALAVRELKRCLAQVQGVVDISDDNDVGQLELRIVPLPTAAAAGFTVDDIAQQVRGLLFGIDAHVYAQRQEDIDVRVRVDKATRESVYAIENAWLVNGRGQRVPMSELARIEEAATYSTIRRIDRERAVTVTAETVPSLSPEKAIEALDLDAVRNSHPNVTIAFAGRQEQQSDAFASLPLGFIAALVMIYIILAWLFGSYVQPLLVMLAIPFATIGVIWGHYLLGYEMTFLSLIGFVALSGIVVNDSLILVEFYNAERKQGESVYDALVHAGRARVRAIMLTTMTTVLGLTPLILEQSFQARFLIPMAISIAVGLLSATGVILIVLPCLILILDDVFELSHRLWFGRPRDVGGAAAGVGAQQSGAFGFVAESPDEQAN